MGPSEQPDEWAPANQPPPFTPAPQPVPWEQNPLPSSAPAPADDGPPTRPSGPNRSQWIVAGVLAVAVVGSMGGWALSETGLSQSGAYFIGVPGLMAILIALVPGRTPTDGRSSGFATWRATTVAILGSAILLREGFVCVLLALPLILPIIGLIIWATKKSRDEGRPVYAFGAVLFLLLGSAEGAAFEVQPAEVGQETRSVAATTEQVEAALTGTELPTIEPLLLRLPFPKPQSMTGGGIDIGDRRTVHFTDGEIVLEVSERTDRHVRWDVVEHTTPMARWMELHHATVAWTPTDHGVRLDVRVGYERSLSPGFYFGPLQGWGVDELSHVLADMVETNLCTTEMCEVGG